MVNRAQLAAFLRVHRNQLQPSQVGLPDGQRRRTPGLRRQEVAQLCGISVEYYVRLEQGRGPRPSRQILGALARGLMLSADEREYLYRIAGEAAPDVVGPNRDVPHAVRRLLSTLEVYPAYVLDATYELLAWNQMATHFIGDANTMPEGSRNIIRWIFTRPDTDRHWDDEAAATFARGCVADLRAAMARYPGSLAISNLVTELLATSVRFGEVWNDHTVEVRRSVTKRVEHPVAGSLEFDCQVLHIPDSDQRLIIYVAEPGTPTYSAFCRLRESVQPTPVLGSG